jgi:iron complex outermembrane receptor protein
MMCCNTFWNINNGERTRFGTFVELETKWAHHITTLVGARNDVVLMDTGNVQGYSNINPAMFYANDANAFNALKHAQTDVNFDITALTRYEPTPTDTYEAGYARKTRSPNLYERYTWSANAMAAQMNGWFGDSNGYVGDINLKPEVANTASFTAGWRDHTGKDWQLKVTTYYTYVEDYINVDRIRENCPVSVLPNGSCPFLPVGNGKNSILRYANHDAELYGVDVGGSKFLWETPDFGRFSVSGTVGYVQGQLINSGDSLYHMMPLNTNLALQQKWGRWTNSLELQMVNEKDVVDPIRKELPTGGYGLVNLRSSYEFEHIRLDFGVENLFDLYYEPPLGGVDIGMQPLIYPVNLPVHAVPGMGRNFYAGLTAKF